MFLFLKEHPDDMAATLNSARFDQAIQDREVIVRRDHTCI